MKNMIYEELYPNLFGDSNWYSHKDLPLHSPIR